MDILELQDRIFVHTVTFVPYDMVELFRDPDLGDGFRFSDFCIEPRLAFVTVHGFRGSRPFGHAFSSHGPPDQGVHYHGFFNVPHFHILSHLIIEAPGDPGIEVHDTGKGRDIHRPFDLPETIHVVPDLELEGVVIPGSGNNDIGRKLG